MEIKILKCHGSGNDFILIDEIDTPLNWSDEARSKFAITLCDRQSKLGADGILFVQKGKEQPVSVRIFNSDGSEASMCGNGLRCTARYACEKFGVDVMTFETLGGLIHTYKMENIYEDIQTYCVEISPIYLTVDKLPMNWTEPELINQPINDFDEGLRFTAIAVPNPHLIAVVEDMEDFNNQEKIANIANSDNPYFPDGVNVSFVKVIQDGVIYVRTYERGVGFTNACGTAMSASSYITKKLGHHGSQTEIKVYNDGGFVRCTVACEDKVNLIGNATFEFTATVSYDSSHDGFEISDKIMDMKDVGRYASLQMEASSFLSEHLL